MNAEAASMQGLAAGEDFRATVATRVRTLLPQKLWLMVWLSAAISAPYFAAQHLGWREPWPMPRLWLDRAVPFAPGWAWIYETLYLLTPIGPFLLTRRAQLRAYTRGMLAMSVTADVAFVLWPTTIPRPDAPDANIAYRLLAQLDAPLNACPSLHAAFAVFSACCAALVFREMRAPAGLRAALWIWVALIFHSTLATRQHVALDLLAGAALAAFAARLFLQTKNHRP